MSRAAKSAGVHRVTVAKWVSEGKLKTRTKPVRNLTATLVNLAEVRKLVGGGLKPGRPAKAKGAAK